MRPSDNSVRDRTHWVLLVEPPDRALLADARQRVVLELVERTQTPKGRGQHDLRRAFSKSPIQAILEEDAQGNEARVRAAHGQQIWQLVAYIETLPGR